jgi:hypothetical protein
MRLYAIVCIEDELSACHAWPAQLDLLLTSIGIHVAVVVVYMFSAAACSSNALVVCSLLQQATLQTTVTAAALQRQLKTFFVKCLDNVMP